MKKVLAVISMVLLVSMFFSFAAQATEPPRVFEDVFETDWYYEDVMMSYGLSLMGGKGNKIFDPMGNVSVAEAITVASRILSDTLKDGQHFYNGKQNWYDSYISYAISKKIISETDYESYTQNITRFEVAELFAQVVKRSPCKVINSIYEIPDLPKDNEAYRDILLLYNMGILNGADEYGNFYPCSNITRAEMSAIINRISVKESRLKYELKCTEYSDYYAVQAKIASDVSSDDKIFVSSDSYEASNNILRNLYKAISDYGGNCSFYLVTLDGKLSVGYNINKGFGSASTVKLPFLLYCYKELERGNGTYQEVLTYKGENYCGGSGVIKNSSIGTEYSIDTVVYDTIHYSDNIGYYMLQDRFKIDGYNKYLKSIGCSRMALENGVRWGMVYAREFANIWNEIYLYSQSSTYGKDYFRSLIDSNYNFIKDAHIAEYGTTTYDIAHKSGFSDDGRHDTAIVLKEVPYIITIFSEPVSSGKEKTYLSTVAIILDRLVDEYNKTVTK